MASGGGEGGEVLSKVASLWTRKKPPKGGRMFRVLVRHYVYFPFWLGRWGNGRGSMVILLRLVWFVLTIDGVESE